MSKTQRRWSKTSYKVIYLLWSRQAQPGRGPAQTRTRNKNWGSQELRAGQVFSLQLFSQSEALVWLHWPIRGRYSSSLPALGLAMTGMGRLCWARAGYFYIDNYGTNSLSLCVMPESGFTREVGSLGSLAHTRKTLMSSYFMMLTPHTPPIWGGN